MSSRFEGIGGAVNKEDKSLCSLGGLPAAEVVDSAMGPIAARKDWEESFREDAIVFTRLRKEGHEREDMIPAGSSRSSGKM